MKRCMQCLVFLFLALMSMVPQSFAADAPAIVVGRVNDVEGDLLRYVPATKDWVAVVNDAPFGTGDTLFTGNQGMAELAAPNGAWIRFGNSTQIQFIALDADVAEMDVASGVARFYNKGSNTIIKATSPFGYVLANPGTVFDYYVGENSIELVAVTGTVSFVHSTTNAKYDVAAGSPSLLADQSQVSSGTGSIEPNWDQWNAAREAFWAEKANMGGRSVGYLPPSLQNEAYALEENGTWEKIPYDREERWFWRPTTVAVGWSPFTVGRWTEWSGDQTWVPAEPFGYVTHHYGNWIFVGNYWYWAPPVVSVRVGVPLLDVGFAWSPGRVSWIHSGDNVGWVPLAPQETYYGHRQWGGLHEVVVTELNIGSININIGRHAYVNHAVVVNQNNFFGSNSYRDVRVTNVSNTTIVNNFRAAPVVNNTVINNYTTNNRRYNYTNVAVTEKPHNTAITRIQQNEKIISGGKKENAAVLQQQVKKIPEGKINQQVKVDPPKATSNIVPANQVNQPKSGITLQQKEIKGTGPTKGAAQAPPTQPGPVAPPTKATQPTPPTQPGPVAPPTKSVQPTPPTQPGPVVPPTKATQPTPPTQPGPVTPPTKSVQPTPPTPPTHPGPVAPPTKPAQQPAQAAPAKPAPQPQQAAPAKPAPQPQQTAPAKAAPQKAAPAKTDQEEKKKQ